MKTKSIVGGNRNSRANHDRGRQTVRSAARLWAERLEQRVLLSTGTATPAAPYLPPQHELLAHSGFLTKPAHGKPLTIALNYLRAHAPSLGIKTSDLTNPIVTNQYTDPDTGETHIYLGQRVNGLPVANANLSISLTRDNRVIMAAGDFVHGASAKTSKPTLSAQQALAHVAPSLGIATTATSSVRTVQSSAQAAVLSSSQVSKDPIPAAAQYIATPAGLKLAWQMVVRTPDGQHWYQTFADASTGASLGTVDWTDHLESYDVYALPIEAPNDGSRSIVTDPADPTYSPFGWHDTNGVAGAEFTVTDGNNVNAYVDANNSNTVGFQPNGGASLNFDFPIDATQAPSTYQSATVSQLFYLVNELHDIHAHYGFTEAAGNFQQTDYSGQGLGNDQVLAEDQDGGGTNNANFATPPDGQSPRMQMYNWTYAVPSRDGSLDNEIVTHEFGHGVSNRLTGGPANASALTATQSGGMGEGWSDWWALMFTQKQSGAQNDAYPQGTYVLGQTTSGGGIRRYPYSYNMTTDPLTFARYGLSGDTEVHDTGEIWCSTLWDMNWLLIQKYGYSPTISQGYNPSIAGENGGNNLALKLVMDALKLQPANPSFTNARDAIIAADQALNGGKDLLQIWTAFARRGLGNSAVDSSANATTVATAFDVPQSVQYPQVVSQSPTGAQTSPLSSIDFTFSTAMDPTSFSIADDVKSFNGPAAIATPGPDLTSQITGFSWLNNNTTLHITFTPQSNKGRYTMSIGPQILAASNGAAMDQNANGTPGEATTDQYTATFGYEPTLLQVTSTTPAGGSLVSLPLTTLDVHFNEPFDPASIGTSDLKLSQGTVTAATAVDATTARYALSGITSEGTLNISMPAGAVNDADGFGMQAYSSSFTTDIGTLPLPTATSVLPLGSLIYQTSSPGVIGPASDTDSFTINLDAGQTLTVTVSGVTTLQPTVQVTDSNSNVLGTATSSAAGQSALLQTLPAASAGTYTITVGGVQATIGAYTVTATLNAAQKAVNFGGPANQSLASAQELSGSFESLGSGASRAAVLGGPNGGILTPLSNNFENGLAGFTIANTVGGLWHLSTGRGSQTGHSATQSIYFGQGEGPSGGGTYNTGSRVAGTVTSPSFSIPAGTSMSLNFNYVLQTEGSPTWDQALVQISTNGGSTFTTLTNLSGTAESTSWRAATPISLSAYAGQTVQLRFSFDTIDSISNNFEGWYVDDIVVSGAVSSLSDYYSLSLNAGDSASLALKGGGSGVDLKLLDSSGNVVASSVTGATNVDRTINNFVAPTIGTYYAFVTATANASAYSLVVTRNAAFDIEPNGATSPQTLGTQAAALGAISGADEDRYSLTLAAGQSLAVHTQSPGGGPGQFVNLLDPALAIYNSGGTLVASDDNSAADGRNALISYTAPAAGTYIIRVYSNTNSSGEYILNLGDALTLSAPKDVNEGDGTATATLTATSAPASDVTVSLSSSDPSRLSAPATVVLPAGQTSVQVPLTIVDNSLLDGLEAVTIAASAQTYFGGSVSVNVHDNETATLTVTLPATATEGDGTISGTVTSSDAPTRDVTVLLSSDLPARLTVPPTVTLKAGQTTANFKANVIDNTTIDGTQTAKVTASVENWTNGTAAVSISDNDAVITVSMPTDGWEGQMVNGTVRIGGTLTTPLVINLASSDTTTATIPASVTIPAGQTSVSLSINLIDDGVSAGSRSASILATSNGLAGGSSSVVVHDVALDHLAFDPITGSKTAGVPFSVNVRACNIANEVIAPYSGNGTLGAGGQSGPLSVTPSSLTFAAGTWSGNVALTTADTSVKLTAGSGGVTASSGVFAVQGGALANLNWSAISSPQVANAPFITTLTAKDTYGNVATAFNGSVDISGLVGTGPTSTLLISEVFCGTPDSIELTNVSNNAMNVGGWQVFIYDVDYYPAPRPTTFTFPTGTSIPSGSVFLLQEYGTSPGTYPTFFTGENIDWTSSSGTKTAVLLRDSSAKIVDFFAGASASAAAISNPTTIPSTQWQGSSVASPSSDSFSYTRTGSQDNNNSSDWVLASPTQGTKNATLTVPFPPGATPVTTTPTQVTFTNGVWTGSVSIGQAAVGMHLHADDGAGHIGDSNNFDAIVQTLGLSLPSDVREDDGSIAGILNVSPAPASDMTVTLTSSDPARLSAPATVIVPAGATSVPLTLTAIDNTVLDGLEPVTITASANQYSPASAVINVHDNETAALTVSIPASAKEGDGALSGTITASAAPTQDITIQLSSSNTSRVTVPATVKLLAGQTTASFSLQIVDNTVIDGTQIVTVSTAADGWTSAFKSISVADNDNYVTVTLPAGGWEGQTLANAGTVTIGGTLSTDLTVSLTTDDSTKLSIPSSIKILAGQTLATFTLTIPTDALKEGTRSASVSATAQGLSGASSNMVIHDSNADHMAFDPISGPMSAGVGFSATVRAYNVANEVIAVYANSATLSAAGQSGTQSVSPTSFAFVAGVWTGNVTLTKIDPAVVLTATTGAISCSSNSFVLQAGPVASFAWATVTSPQPPNTPLPQTVTAKDAFGNLATTFNGSVTLSASGLVTTSQTILGNSSYTSVSSATQTQGYAFTPSVTALLTAVRSYFGSKVCIWTDSGTLLASQNVSGTIGTWTETALTTPLLLTAGVRYRVSVFASGSIYWRSDVPTFTWGAINGSYFSSGDAFPTTSNSGTYLVDLRANVATTSSVPISPTAVTLTDGIWSGNLAVNSGATAMHLHVFDSLGHIGDSNNFDVIGAPQMVDLNASTDSGSSSTDNLTNFNNSTPATAPSFTVFGTTTGATVRIYADGNLIGSAQGAAQSTVVTCDGATTLSDGTHSITARQMIAGVESVDSAALAVTIDTVAPPAPPTPTLDAASDSGSLGDALTNVRMPTFDVQASEAGLLHLIHNNLPGSFDTTVNGAGTYSISTIVNVAPLWPLAPQPQTFAPQTMNIADVTGDGIADAITCGTAVMVLPGNGNGTFGSAVAVFTPNRTLFGVNTADLNGDGKLDLLVAESGFVVPLLNLGGLNFAAQTPISLPVSNYVATGDLNGDGKMDVVATNGGQNTFSIWFGKGDGSFQSPTNVSTATSPGRVAISDFNRDGLPDLAVISSSLNAIYVFMGTGAGNFGSPQFVAAGANPQDLTIGDFNGDGKPDIVSAAVNDASAVVLLGNGDGTFTNRGKIAVDQAITSIRSGDFNGDGKLDFVVTNHRIASTDAISLFLGNGDGSFQARQVVTAGTYVPDCGVGDANGDASIDLIIADYGASQIQVMLGGGQPTDGIHTYRAWAEDKAGNHSVMSAPLLVTIDTKPPTASLSALAAAPGSNVVGNIVINFSEPVSGLELTSLSLSYNGGPNLLTSAQTLTPTPTGSYILGNLAPLDVLAGNYVLTLAPAKITDLAANAMLSGATAQWTTDPLKGTAGDDSYYFKADGNQIDLWFNQPTTDAPAIKLSRSLANQIVHGMGGNDTITIDQSAGDLFPFFKSLDNSGIAAGKINLKVVGSSSDDLFSVNSSTGQIGFGSSVIAVSQLTSVDYTDGGGNDTLNITGALAVTLHVGSGTDTLNLDTGVNVTAFIHSDSTGDLILNGPGNTTIWYI